MLSPFIALFALLLGILLNRRLEMFHQTTLDLEKAYEPFMALVAQNCASQTDRDIAAFYAEILHNLEPALQLGKRIYMTRSNYHP